MTDKLLLLAFGALLMFAGYRAAVSFNEYLREAIELGVAG